MSVADRLSRRLARGRAIAEALMLDECAVLRKIGTTTDPDTGAVVPEYATVYTGRCRLKMTSDAAMVREAGEQPVTLSRIQLQVPWTEDDLAVNDKVVITASQSVGNVGRTVKVTGPWVQSLAVMCRYPCVESTLEGS